MKPLAHRKNPLHERVAASLRELIRQQPAGARLPNDADHAARLGVSVVTVRDAMRLLEQEGLVSRKRGAGTFVNAPPSTGRVAILCVDDVFGPVGRLYWLPALQRLQEGLVAMGYTPDVHMEVDGFLDEALLLGGGARQAPRGLILFHASPPMSQRIVASCAALPIVSCIQGVAPYWVHNDVEGLVREAVALLARAGCRRPGMIYPHPPTQPPSADWQQNQFRLGASYAPVPAAGLRFARVVTEPTRPGAVAAAFASLWELPAAQRPDGLFVADDSLYPEVAMAILQRGIRVPEELRVISHANLGSGQYYPFPTERLAFDPRAVADEALAKLRRLLVGELPDPPCTILPFHYVPSDSVEPQASPEEPQS